MNTRIIRPMPAVNVKLLREHLDAKCPPENLAEKNGILYLPIDRAERMLDELCSEFYLTWHTRNYKSQVYQIQPSGDLLISASIEVILKGNGYFKCVVGATSFYAKDYYPNTFYDGIAKSLATVNGCADFGDWFGRFLSNQEHKGEVKKDKRKAAVKMIPDQAVRQQYAKAVGMKDYDTATKLESIYIFDGK